MTGEKVLLKFNNILSQNYLPKSKGLSKKNLFDEMRNDAQFIQYFPDMSREASVPRKYFLTVRLLDPSSCTAW